MAGRGRFQSFPHTLIVAERHAKVTVVDYFQSLGSEPGFACGVTDLAAAEGASINYVCCQRWSRKVKAIHFVSTLAGRDASVQKHVPRTRGRLVAHRKCCLASGPVRAVRCCRWRSRRGPGDRLAGPARSTINRTRSPTSSSRTCSSTRRARSSPGSSSSRREPTYTDAYQTCRNLLLSEEAEANALPGLEINADQVKCSHGSTSGPLGEDQIHYLRSRGIPETAARQLLAFGFCLDVVHRIGHPELESVLTAMVEEKFRRMRRVN